MSRTRQLTGKTITTYDAEKKANSNNGIKSHYLRYDDPDDPRSLDDRIAEIKAKQKIANDAFNQKKRQEKKTIEQPVLQQPVLQRPIVEQPIPSASIVVLPEFKLILDEGTGNTTFLIGSSKQGKSTLLMHIYDKYYSTPDFISVLWTMSPQIPLYKGHKNMLKCGIWDNRSHDIIKSMKFVNSKTKNKYKFLNMLDDILELRNDKLLQDLILTYRNSQMSTIFSIQYSNLLSKCGRANANNIILFGLNTDEAIEVVIKTFLTGYLKKIGVKTVPDQINWYKEQTRDHKFIYLKPSDGHVSFHRL